MKRDSENATVVRAGISSSEQLAVHVGLGHDVGSIRFVEKHLLDVQGVLEEETGQVAYSMRCRSVIPREAGHPFHGIPVTHSTRCRSAIPRHPGHF